MVAYPLFLVSNADVNWSDIAEVLAWVAIVPALVFAYWSAAVYVPLARQALRDGRVGSAS
jgi:hypothetical protein